MFDSIKYDRLEITEAALKKIIIFLSIPLLASCATLDPVEPETPIGQMSTYELQNEYLDVEHIINELEQKINERKFSQSTVINSNFTGNSAILLVIALNSLNSLNAYSMTTKLENYRSRLSEITTELSKRGMYGP